ncbi:MAG: tyrosine-type recombinase/integrase [Hyphomonadaceae bacterium]
MAGIHRLSARAVATVKTPGLHADGGGLYLQVTLGADGAVRRSWLLRFTAPDGRRREMGLGSAELVGLCDARDAALAARKQVAAGVDPIAARTAHRAEVRAKRKPMTFRECADAYMESHAAGWKNAKHRWQWRNSLELYAYPVFGKAGVDAIDVNQVVEILDPIWTTKTETASRLRGRIEAILDWAAVRGHRKGDNPARWRGHLQKALPVIKKSLRVKHHPALPYAQMPSFMSELGTVPGISARALEFCILTATRTGETIHARWEEIDLNAGLWIIPAARMKIPREHRVPLSAAALALLRSLNVSATNENDFIFAGRKPGAALSNMAMLMTLKRMRRNDLTTHGFRSSFRDWAAEKTDFPREVAEAALAHSIGSQVEAAYRRGDLFDKRRALMDAWADFCAHTAVKSKAPRRPEMSA